MLGSAQVDYGTCGSCAPDGLFALEGDLFDGKVDAARAWDARMAKKRLAYINFMTKAKEEELLALYNSQLPVGYQKATQWPPVQMIKSVAASHMDTI